MSSKHYIPHTKDFVVQGGIVPGAGSNKITEPDTTVFKGKNAAGCGQTKGVSCVPIL